MKAGERIRTVDIHVGNVTRGRCKWGIDRELRRPGSALALLLALDSVPFWRLLAGQSQVLAVGSDAAGLIIEAGNGAGLIDARRRGAILGSAE